MPKTYYDSELTGAQIESALEAINGVVTPSNNGKVLYIDNGQIKAASASRWGHGAVLEPLSVTANGDYTPPSGTDGFDEVHVAVPSATLTTKSITQNGTYNASSDNADGYSSVTVDVQGGGSAVVQPLSITQNGTYNPPSGVDGYAPVTVNVSGGGVPSLPAEYQEVEYVECYGTEYCKINQSVGLCPLDQIEVEISLASGFTISSEAAFFGSNSSGSFEIYVDGSTNKISFYGSVSGISYPTTAIERDTKYFISARSQLGSQLNEAWFFFGRYRPDKYPFAGRLYSLSTKIVRTNLEVLTVKLVPCYRKADSVIGFYDVVNSVFYTNVGGGAFGKGPDVN